MGRVQPFFLARTTRLIFPTTKCCRKKTAQITLTEVALENAATETEYEVDFYANAGQVITNWRRVGKLWGWTNKLRYKFNQCPDIHIESEDSGYPKTITLDYGDSTVLQNGKVFSGLITIEISLKIFANDLVQALEKAGESKIYLGEKRENPMTNEYLVTCLKSHLKFTVNGHQAPYSFIGKEMETDVVWSYLEINNIEEVKSVSVECNLLTEIFDTQNNIIQVNNGVETKNMLLSKKRTFGEIKF